MTLGSPSDLGESPSLQDPSWLQSPLYHDGSKSVGFKDLDVDIFAGAGGAALSCLLPRLRRTRRPLPRSGRLPWAPSTCSIPARHSDFYHHRKLDLFLGLIIENLDPAWKGPELNEGGQWLGSRQRRTLIIEETQGGRSRGGITHTHRAANHGGIFKMLNIVVVLIY